MVYCFFLIYPSVWTDPPFLLGQLTKFRLGHGFQFANCYKLPEGMINQRSLLGPLHHAWQDSLPPNEAQEHPLLIRGLASEGYSTLNMVQVCTSSIK